MKKTESNFSYYQYRSEHDYQVYLRFEDFDFESQITEVLEVIGFDKVERSKVKDISINPTQTKILKITKANARVARQISKSDFIFDKYGPESLSHRGHYKLYRYRSVGLMVLSDNSSLWELGLRSTNNQDALRVIFTRFLSFALAQQGVLGFWGVPVEEGFVVMNPLAANFESVFVDLQKHILLTYDGVKPIDAEVHILRLDATLNQEAKLMSKEELISFLSNNTNYMSYDGFDYKFRSQLYELCRIAHAYIYPEQNFKPRAEESEAA